MSLSDAQFLLLDKLCKGTGAEIERFRGKRALGDVPSPTLQALLRQGYVESRQREVTEPGGMALVVSYYVTDAGRAAYDAAARRWQDKLTAWRTGKGVVTVPRWTVEELLQQREALVGPDAAAACDALAQVLG